MRNPAATGVRTAAVAAVMLVALAACAGGPGEQKDVPAADICPPDSKLFCRKRMGTTYSCTCKSRESLRDILEPYPE